MCALVRASGRCRARPSVRTRQARTPLAAASHNPTNPPDHVRPLLRLRCLPALPPATPGCDSRGMTMRWPPPSLVTVCGGVPGALRSPTASPLHPRPSTRVAVRRCSAPPVVPSFSPRLPGCTRSRYGSALVPPTYRTSVLDPGGVQRATRTVGKTNEAHGPLEMNTQ